MTPEQFSILLKSQQAKLALAISTSLPVAIGKKAVDLFTENFQKEGFQDNGAKPWKEVQRRARNARGAAGSRKILTGKTGDLGRSIKYEVSPGKVTVYSDVIYADVHNEGLKAGRGAGFTMPKRQFIGDSADLDKIIDDEIEKTLNSILK
jgi:phage gpG-like protein